ncbi:hypothetical protein [Streptomyces sp. H49]|uniref:hypothetical protein n=1 Tax=Streptomyces sp. H49 TaxID=3444117 RepID=UPI003F4A8688
MGRNTDAWQKSADALEAAENAYREAVDIYGADSPEALVADEKAFAESDRHFGIYGNPFDGRTRFS